MRWDSTLLGAAAAALLATASPALAAGPATSVVNDGTPSSIQDIAVDADGTIHLVWERFEPDPRPTARYCRIAPGTAVCAAGSTRVLPVPPKANESLSYSQGVEVLRPGGDRVVVVLGVLHGGSTRSLVFESTDGGGTFGAGQETGEGKPGGNVPLGTSGVVLQGATINHVTAGASAPIKFFRSPIGGPGPAAIDLFADAASQPAAIAGTNDAMVVVASAGQSRLQFRQTKPGADPALESSWTPAAPVPGDLGDEWSLQSAPDGAYLYAHRGGSERRTVSRWTPAGGWSAPVEVPFDDPRIGFSGSDVGVAANGVVSVAYDFSGPNAGTCVTQSSDGGTTWSVPVLAGRNFGEDIDVASAAAGKGLLLFQEVNGQNGIQALTLTPDKDNPCGLAPGVTTLPATEVSQTGARLNGTVAAQGQATTYRFEYGLDRFGTLTSTPEVPVGSPVSQVVGGLQPGKTYVARVVATNPTGTTRGAFVEWTTAAAPVAPPVTPPVVRPKPQLAQGQVLSLPSASSKRCVSRRSFKIRVKKLAGVRYDQVTVTVNGKQVKVLRGARDTAGITLKGLPKGRVTVRITVTTTDGRTVSATRKYRTCTPKRRGSGSRL